MSAVGLSFWRAVMVEFMGTSCFIYLVTAVLIHQSDIVTVAFAIGLAIAVLAHVFGPISGGHFNPAITVGTIVTGDVKIIKAVCYIIAQIAGGKNIFLFQLREEKMQKCT